MGRVDFCDRDGGAGRGVLGGGGGGFNPPLLVWGTYKE